VEATQAAVLDQVGHLQDEATQLCQDIVRINTVNPYSGDRDTGLEKHGQAYLEPILDSMGARTTLFEPPPDIYQRMGVLGPKGRSFKDRPNLVAEFDLGGEGPTIILNGHMDTVGVSDMTIDPFSGEVKDGAIWGRGSSDCKGGLTTAVIATKALLPYQDQLAGRIIFQSVVDEECSGSGAGTLACCDAGYRGHAAVVVDGNDLQITLGCGGCLTADLYVQGRAGHAARGGISAIDKGLVVKSAIDAFKAQRERRFPDARVNLGGTRLEWPAGPPRLRGDDTSPRARRLLAGRPSRTDRMDQGFDSLPDTKERVRRTGLR
jgi:acetylornithine deacetylase/succinyl-diaminopimelate desuccinylase-like protein